jgi:hypothetical protein
MPGNSSTINSILYAAGPKTAGRLGRAIQTQATGKKDQSKNQVNKAIEMRTNFYISKTEGALQNIKTAQGFLSTVAQNLETTLDKLTDMTQSIMTLLNGVIPAGDKEAAVAGLLEGLGMVDNATFRSEKEGVIVKSLRQGGSGQALYFRSASTVSASPFLAPAGRTASSDVDELQSIVDFDNKVLTKLNADVKVFVEGINPADASTDTAAKVKTAVTGEVTRLKELIDKASSGFVTKLKVETAKLAASISDYASLETAINGVTDVVGLPSAEIKAHVLALGKAGFDQGTGPADIQTKIDGELDRLVTFFGEIDAAANSLDDTSGPPTAPELQATAVAAVEAQLAGHAAEFQTHADALAASGGGSSSRPTTALATAKNFIINPNSNYGSGDFYLTYEAGNIKVFDEFDSLIESYPLPSAEFEKAFPTGAADPALIKVGTIGFIEFQPAIWDSGAKTVDWTDQGIFFNVKTADLSATITVSGNDGTRTISMPDLTNPVNLWGVEEGTVLDPQLLQDNVAYQQEVKGFIDHASQVVRSQLQTINNVMATLQTDEEAQNVSLQSSHDQVDTVSMADPVVSAQQVLTISQEQSRLVNALYIMSGLDRKNNEQAQQIAQMASA